MCKLLLIMTLIISTTSCQKTVNPEIEKNIGQLFLLGFRGMDIKDNPNIEYLIKEKNLGAIVLFDYDVPSKKAIRNIESFDQVKKLVAQLQALRTDPLIVSIDQEGGIIRRLKKKFGFNRGVSHQFLGKLNDLEQTKLYTDTLAKQLNDLGINLNLAPVVDVDVNTNNPIIAKLERSFSADPKVVSEQAEAYIEALHKNNVRSTLKHFPGHGSSKSDSHLGLVDVTETWKDYELDPYRYLIKTNKVDAIMTAHVYLKHYDENYPATLSKKIIDGLLRKELTFDGLIISDDMNMKAISSHYGLKKALELTINAGIDMIAIGNNGDSYDDKIGNKAMDIVLDLIREGKISEESILESFERIKRFKRSL